MAQVYEEYPLLTEQDDEVDDDSVRSKVQCKPSSVQYYAVVIFSTVLTLVSLCLALSNSRSNSVKETRRPNPYVNLKTHLSSMEPVIKFSYAQVVMQLNTSDPLRRLQEDTRQHWTPVGTVYPDDRRVLVSSNTSTVINLRTVDFGLERCTLMATLPKNTKTLDPAAILRPNSLLNIWELDSAREILRYQPNTWLYAPPRRQYVGEFEFLPGETWYSTDFPCRGGTFFTFEVSCSESRPDCYVEFWQDRELPNGIFMKQTM